MQIKDRIDEIIKRRKAKVPGIKNKVCQINQIMEELQEIAKVRSKMLANSQQFQITDDVRQRIGHLDASETIRELNTLMARYLEVLDRFSRDEISIAVVGGARQGKSKLLQSISNLSDNVIPAFESNDCTGAASVIKNVPGAAVSAKISFLTETEVMRSVQAYLDEIFGTDAIQLGSFGEIEKLRIIDLEKRMEPGSPKATKFEHLKKYIEHFNEWSPLVRERERTIEDETQIQCYVAQHNGLSEQNPNRENYYYYLAVKNVEISCTFQNPETGKIVLRDTIGLGDTSLGIEEKMLDAIGLHSDAAVIVRRPEVSIGRFEEADGALYGKLRDRFNCRGMGKWLFWLINHTTDQSPYGDNMDRCKAFRDTIQKWNWDLAGNFIINVADNEQVNGEFLPSVLETLIQNMDSIDQSILTGVREQTVQAYQSYEKLQQAVKGILLSEMGNSVDKDEFLDQRWKNFYDRGLMKSVMAYRNELKTRKDEESEQFREYVKNILKSSTSLLPEVDTLTEELESGGHNRAHEVYSRHIDQIRTNFTEQFLGIDEGIFDKQTRQFKERVVDIFAEKDGGRLSCLLPVEQTEEKAQWLCRLSEEIFEKKKRYSQFKTAFYMLGNFQISVRGFLMHRIRTRIDRLNSDGFQPTGTSTNEIAREIRDALAVKLKKVCEELDAALERNEFYKDPNRIFYAVMEEFYDRINFSYAELDSQDAESMWKSLYREHCHEIWMDEFSKNQAISELYNEWSSLAERLKAHSIDDFTMN